MSVKSMLFLCLTGLFLCTPFLCHGQVEHQITVRGKIQDSEGKPVSNARIWFDIETWHHDNDQLLEEASDANGDFVMMFPSRHLDGYSGRGKIWVSHPDYQLEPLSITSALKGEMDRFTVTLLPAKPVKINLVDSGGDAIAGANVSPWVIKTGKEAHQMDVLSDRVMDSIAVTTDPSGNATLTCLSPIRFLDVRIAVNDHWPRYHRPAIRSSTLDDDDVRSLTLGKNGGITMEFQSLEAEVPKSPIPLRWSWVYQSMETFSYSRPVDHVDFDDVLSIRNVAAGFYKASISGLQDSKLVAEFPDMFNANSQNQHYVVPLVKGVRFQTRLVDEDTGEPLSDVRVRLMFGKSMQAVTVISGNNGNVEGYVLPGLVWLDVPFDYYRDLPQRRTVHHEFQVPDDDEFVADVIPVPTTSR